MNACLNLRGLFHRENRDFRWFRPSLSAWATISACIGLLFTGAVHDAAAQIVVAPNPNSPLLARGTVYAVLVQPDDKVVIGGNFHFVNGVPRDYIARLNPDGTLDETWNPSANGVVRALVMSGPYLYVGGDFTVIGGQSRWRIARLSITGTGNADPLLVANANGAVYALAVGSSGIYAGGDFTTVNGQPRNRLVRLSSGAVDASWDFGANSGVRALLLNGTDLYVGGAFTTLGGQTRNRLAKIAVTGPGALDPTWNPNANNTVHVLALSGGSLYVAGDFTSIGSQTRYYLARLAMTGAGSVDSWNPNPNIYVRALVASSDDVYVGGAFTSIAGQLRNRAAKISLSTGAVDPSWDPNAGDTVLAIALSSAGVYLGGDFDRLGADSAFGIARVGPTDGVKDPVFEADTYRRGEVRALAIQSDGKAVVGGDFIAIGSAERRHLARFDTEGLLDDTWTPEANAAVNAIVIAETASDTNIYVGGEFTEINGTGVNYLASLDPEGGLTPAWNPNPNYHVRALAASDGSVYAGGDFTSIGGTSRNRIAKLASDGTADPVWNPNASGVVNTLLVDGGAVYAGGTFTTIGGTNRNRIAKLNPSGAGAADGTWNPNANSTVNALAVGSGGLFVGGNFTSIGGTNRNRIAKLTSGGTADSAWNPNASHAVYALAIRGTNLYAGGDFIAIGGLSRARVARLSPSGAGTADPEWQADADGSVRALSTSTADLYIGGGFGVVQGELRDGLAFLLREYLPGEEVIRPDPAEVPELYNGPTVISNAGMLCWNLPTQKLYAQVGIPGEVALVTWSNALAVEFTVQVAVQSLEVSDYVLGEAITPPASIDVQTLLDSGPVVEPSDAAFWHLPTRRLYAVRDTGTSTFTVTWGTGSTNECPGVTTVHRGHWPTDPSLYQLHVAGSPPVDLARNGAFTTSRLLHYDPGVGVDTNMVYADHEFAATGAGRSLLLLSPDIPSQSPNIYFQFVQTVKWDDPNYLHDQAPAAIGQEITGFFGYHDANFGQPFVFHPLARYCALEGYYDRTNRTGPIIPVNRDHADTVEDDMVLICYQPAERLLDPGTGELVANANLGWPHQAVRYDCQWPDPAPGTIVIASQRGTGPIGLTDPGLYVQPDESAPGYNPNEEHALILPAAGRTSQLRLGLTEARVMEGSITEVELRIVAESAPETNVTLSISSARDGDPSLKGSLSPLLPEEEPVTEMTVEVGNWNAPQTLYFRALDDPDSTDGTNRFVIRASGGFFDQKEILVHAVDTNRLTLVVDAVSMVVPEASTRSFTLRLTQRPTNDVHVLMTREPGSDEDLAWEGTSTVILPVTDWSTPQTVTIAAGSDADYEDGVALFRLTALGGLMQTNLLEVREADGDVAPLAVFALRDDLGDPPGTTVPQYSEPYVLLTHGAADQRQIMVYRVAAEEGMETFYYEGCQAGRLIQPPYPLSVLPAWETSSYFTEGPGWKDRKGFFWAKAAGDDGGPANIVMKFFYPVQDTNFFFPEGPKPLGTLVPWLDRRPGGVQETPTDVTYEITWPVDTPELRVGESLVKAKFGLPNIRGQTSVEVLYEQTAAHGLGPGSSVQVIDPTHAYDTSLVELPDDVEGKTVTNLLSGSVYFTPLPPHLRQRFWFDPTTQRLKFRGEFVEEFGTEEPVGYLLLNVLTAQDQSDLLSLSQDPGFTNAVQDLASQAAAVKIVIPNQNADSLALTAGNAQGTGYVTVAFNNAVRTGLPADRGSPVSLEVIRVGAPQYRGEVKAIFSPDPFDERLTMRHSGDFAGNGPQYEFQWQYHAGPGHPPADSPAWVQLETGLGLIQTMIGGPGLRTLSDYWYRCRWRDTSPIAPLGTNFTEWTEAALAEGWIKRVLGGINFFDQRYSNLVNSTVDTIVNVISQSGARYIGAVPLDQEAAREFGLIEIYESVLKRGIELSIEGNPPVMDEGASRALLLVASRLAQIYLLLGNEAYADASNPTIGFVTTGAQYDVEATSVHCFMDQVDSLLSEELALLRGLDDSDGRNVFRHPVYNRLPWNMTGGDGDIAYIQNYDIRDKDQPGDEGFGVPDAGDAAKIWPQGHGDAWGHYLTALESFYRLVRNPYFLWTVTNENVHLETGGDISVNYQYERKFAQTAAAKAQTGAEIVNLTYRSRYVEDPNGQWQGYLDTQTNRAWGLSEWASRAGQGALFDWALANALLPPPGSEPADYRVDRETVAELREIVAGFVNIQEQLDRADAGLNPLGIAKNVVPFDIDPQEVDAGRTHFEQIYQRAARAMNNAIGVFNHANASTQKLREQADTLQEFQRMVDEREADFRNRLIEAFGYPYADDPAYPSDYSGPDLFHYMYNDYSDITGEPTPGPRTFTVDVRDYVVSSEGRLTIQSQPVAYHVGANGFGLVKPPEWTAPRRAPGEIQMAHSDLLQATARFKRGMAEYENLIAQIEDQSTLLEAQYRLDATEIMVLNAGQSVQESLNTQIRRARTRELIFQTAGRVATLYANAVAEAMPKVFGIIAGLSGGTTMDPGSFGLRQAALFAGNVANEAFTAAANVQSLAELDHQQAKELAQSQQNIVLTTIRQEQVILNQIAQLEQTVRQEVLLRLELYNLREAMQQASGRYSATLARGQRLLEDRLRFRQQTAEQIQNYRYKDMAFRIFRNEALQKYRAQFDLAAMYVYLAAAAYDYETNLRPEDRRIPGQTFMTDIVRARSLGVITGSGDPLPGPGEGRKGDGGLAAALYHMKYQWDNFIKSQLGFNNPDLQQYEFSLRSGWFRIQPGYDGNANWREALTASIVPNMLEFPEFKRYCKEPITGLLPIEPCIIIPFSTSIHFGHNLFGWPETGGGGNFNPTHFATKIRAVGVRFVNYDAASQVGLSPTPYVYFLPVGNDVLRSPVPQTYTGAVPIREWKILDQVLPAPLSITDQSSTFDQTTWIPINEMEMDEQYAALRRYAQMPAYHDAGVNPMDPDGYRRLIGRSVWNTRWLLIIPAGSLLNDRDEALERFINGRLIGGQRTLQGVSDIKIFFKVYSVPGL